MGGRRLPLGHNRPNSTEHERGGRAHVCNWMVWFLKMRFCCSMSFAYRLWNGRARLLAEPPACLFTIEGLFSVGARTRAGVLAHLPPTGAAPVFRGYSSPANWHAAGKPRLGHEFFSPTKRGPDSGQEGFPCIEIDAVSARRAHPQWTTRPFFARLPTFILEWNRAPYGLKLGPSEGGRAALKEREGTGWNPSWCIKLPSSL